ncbi:MAG TPA: hypothetical protein VKC60_13195 [Opitutaceae bacterium]|nr:hypothetical protein [Opitutaceae bacterium]
MLIKSQPAQTKLAHQRILIRLLVESMSEPVQYIKRRANGRMSQLAFR